MTGTPEKGQTAAKAWWKRYVSDPANMWANLSESDRGGWQAVEQAVAAPLEREIERYREALSILASPDPLSPAFARYGVQAAGFEIAARMQAAKFALDAGR